MSTKATAVVSASERVSRTVERSFIPAVLSAWGRELVELWRDLAAAWRQGRDEVDDPPHRSRAEAIARMRV